MRHRLLLGLLVVIVAFALIATGVDAFANLGGLILLILGTLVGIALLMGLVFLVKGALFDRRVSRYDRFN